MALSQRTKAVLLALAAGLTLLTTPARASLETDILDRWYALLGKANAAGLSGLLSPRARIRLNDLGVTQTKQEFLESMQEWGAAIKGGSIRYRIETTGAGQATAVVCYEFTSNEMMTRETFRMVSGLITRSDQAKLAEDCASF